MPSSFLLPLATSPLSRFAVERAKSLKALAQESYEVSDQLIQVRSVECKQSKD